jgi:hypothetical protein
MPTITRRRAVEILIDDTVYTLMKANANGEEGNFILVTEDAYGDTVFSIQTREEIVKRFYEEAIAVLEAIEL